MKIEKINPHGYCGGVVRALKLAFDSIKNNNEPIYMIGKIIHNDIVCSKLEDEGIIIKTNDKLDAINEIDNGTVIFTAHGIDNKIIQKAKDKNLNVIDTTCTKVTIIQKNIMKHINTHKILYIGVHKHPECEAVLSLNKDIILIKDVNDLLNLDKETKYYITNQTTLSLIKLKEIYDYILSNFSNALIDNKICLATTQRQTAVLECDADCIIVVGDKNSSNTKELHTVAKTKCDSYLISEYTEIVNVDLSKYKNIKLTSGASTPEYTLDEVINYLNKTYLNIS